MIRDYVIRSVAAARSPSPSGAGSSARPEPPVPDAVPVGGLRRRFFMAAWYGLNLLLVVSILASMYCIVWEYSTRRYLKGFSDAIIPLTAPPDVKIVAILNWMANGPERNASNPALPSNDRNPTDTLNYASLLKVCGTATNAFINLADSSGLAARRLLLLDSHRSAMHVVAEVFINGKWIVVDPAFRVIPRGADGSFLTSRQLADPQVFAAATHGIPGYDPIYEYTSTAHVRLSRMPYVGRTLRRVLSFLLPGWENSVMLSLLVERKSMAFLVASLVLVVLLAVFRAALLWYGERRMALRSVRLRTRLQHAFHALLDASA